MNVAPAMTFANSDTEKLAITVSQVNKKGAVSLLLSKTAPFHVSMLIY